MRSFQTVTQGRGLFPIDWGYLRFALLKTLIYADDVKIRWLMGIASLAVASDLLIAPETFDRPFYATMRLVSPVWLWAALYAAHGLGAIWRILERKTRRVAAMWVNGLGVAVWFGATVAQNIAVGSFSAATSLELIASFFLLGSFISTGWSSKSTTA